MNRTSGKTSFTVVFAAFRTLPSAGSQRFRMRPQCFAYSCAELIGLNQNGRERPNRIDAFFLVSLSEMLSMPLERLTAWRALLQIKPSVSAHRRWLAGWSCSFFSRAHGRALSMLSSASTQMTIRSSASPRQTQPNSKLPLADATVLAKNRQARKTNSSLCVLAKTEERTALN